MHSLLQLCPQLPQLVTSVVVSVQLFWQQLLPEAHLLPQEPQLFTSLNRSTQAAVGIVGPRSTTFRQHAGFEGCGELEGTTSHSLPQAPQLKKSLLRSAHEVPSPVQQAGNGLEDGGTEANRISQSLLGNGVSPPKLQPPQLWGSVLVSVQA